MIAPDAGQFTTGGVTMFIVLTSLFFGILIYFGIKVKQSKPTVKNSWRCF
jgi:hypothetical protein